MINMLEFQKSPNKPTIHNLLAHAILLNLADFNKYLLEKLKVGNFTYKCLCLKAKNLQATIPRSLLITEHQIFLLLPSYHTS